jgi:hypothetical protein
VPKPGSWWRESPDEVAVCPRVRGVRKFHKIRCTRPGSEPRPQRGHLGTSVDKVAAGGIGMLGYSQEPSVSFEMTSIFTCEMPLQALPGRYSWLWQFG